MIETLWVVIAEVPAALLVILLLGGPTAAWVIYRLLNAPVPQRPAMSAVGLLWVCASCRSANDASRDLCYRCGTAADVDALEIIEPEMGPPSHLRPAMSHDLNLGGRAPVAVGPGKDGTELVPDGAPASRSTPGRPGRTAAPRPRPVPTAAGRAPTAAGPARARRGASASGVDGTADKQT